MNLLVEELNRINILKSGFAINIKGVSFDPVIALLRTHPHHLPKYMNMILTEGLARRIYIWKQEKHVSVEHR